MMAIPGVVTTAVDATAAVGVASIGGVVNVAGAVLLLVVEALQD